MILTEENIQSIIPQRKPFVMVSNLLQASPEGFESDFFIYPDNIFIKNNILQEPALIENIAQTCAAGFGYLNSQQGGEPKLGFIGSITKLKVHALPEMQKRINTKIVVTHQLANIFLVKGENFDNGKKLVECDMKIVVA